MNRLQSFALVVTVTMSSSACSDDDDASPSTQEPATQTRAVLDQIDGYKAWSTFAENPTPVASEDHEGMFVVTYHNDVVAGAVTSGTLPLPDGSLLVKENLAQETDQVPMAITVMHKQGADWYWIKATPEGQVFVDPQGNGLEGIGLAMCTGCHSRADDNDRIFTHEFGQ